MPELPEVEVAARLLERHLAGTRIWDVHATPSRISRASPRPLSDLAGRQLVRLVRRGKNLLMTLNGDVGLFSHLGMSGKWLAAPAGAEPPARHVRATLVLGSGKALHYVDPRLFGRLEVHDAAALETRPGVAGLGPDPLTDGLDADLLRRQLASRRGTIKAALMDQGVVAGLGNIQVIEGLYRAGIHPARRVPSLTGKELEALARALQASIADTIASLEAAGVQYLSEGRTVTNPFRIYGRAGSPCTACGTRLEKVKLAGRGTVLCPQCQSQPRTEGA